MRCGWLALAVTALLLGGGGPWDGRPTAALRTPACLPTRPGRRRVPALDRPGCDLERPCGHQRRRPQPAAHGLLPAARRGAQRACRRYVAGQLRADRLPGGGPVHLLHRRWADLGDEHEGDGPTVAPTGGAKAPGYRRPAGRSTGRMCRPRRNIHRHRRGARPLSPHGAERGPCCARDHREEESQPRLARARHPPARVRLSRRR